MSDWRHEAAAGALRRYLDAVPAPGPALVLRDPTVHAARALRGAGAEVRRWDRMAGRGSEVSAWPPAGPYATVALRMPKAKDELEMLVHAAAGRLREGGILLVYGANDEGIRSAEGRIEPLLGPAVTVETKNRCRVLRVERPAGLSGLRDDLDRWRETWTLEVGDLQREWVSFPGVFAHGRLDAGTALLLDSTPEPDPGCRVLDFGCGSGPIAGVLLHRVPSLEVDLLDADAVALEAARHNVAEARRLVLSDGFSELDGESYDWIVSNPPYHRSKAETLETVQALIDGAPARLEDGGLLALVVQRRLPVRERLERRFGSVEIAAQDGTYRMWLARAPGGS